MRQRTLNLASFPTYLLYAPTQLGGLGLVRLLTRSHFQRHGIMHNMLHTDLKWVIESFCLRALRHDHIVPTHGYQYHLLPRLDADQPEPLNLWITSTIQHARNHNLILSSGGTPSSDTSECSIWAKLPHSTESIRSQYTAAGIHLLSDLIDPITNKWLTIPQLSPLELTFPVPHSDNQLRPEQCWRVNNSQFIIEIHALTSHSLGDPFIYIRKWELPPSTKRPRTSTAINYVVLHTKSSFGFFEPSPYTYDELFPPLATIQRVYLQGDLKHVTGLPIHKKDPQRIGHPKQYVRCILLTIPSSHPYTPDTLHTAADCRTYLFPRLNLTSPYNIYTDASWAKSYANPLIEALHPQEYSSSGGGAIVLMSDTDWSSQPIHIIRLIEDDNQPIHTRHANTWELLTLIAALQISTETHSPLFSDCQSIVNSLLNIKDLPHWRKKDHQFLFSVASHLLKIHTPQITWIKSHPERTTRRSKWTHQEWGIFLADQYASKNPPRTVSFQRQDKSITVLTPIVHYLSLPRLLTSLLPAATYHWSDLTSMLPELYHPKTIWPAMEHTAYISNRDNNYRNGIADRPGCQALQHLPWRNRSMIFAAKAFQLNKLNLSQRAPIVRLIYDWVVHGRKKVLWDDQESGHCPLCEQAEDLAHIITSCSHPELLTKRKQVINDCQQYINNLTPPIAADTRYTAQLNSLPYIAHILSQILHHAFATPLGFQFMIGTWNQQHIDLILPHFPTHDTIHGPTLTQHLQKFTAIMGQGALDLLRLRNQLRTSLTTVTSLTERQRCLPAFFNSVSSLGSRSSFTPGSRPTTSRRTSLTTSSKSTRSSKSI